MTRPSPTDYDLAGLRVRLAGAGFSFSGLDAFAIPDGGVPDIEVRSGSIAPSEGGVLSIDTFDFREADATCRLERCGEELRFTSTPRSGGRPVRFRIAGDGKSVTTDYTPEDAPSLFRFGLWTAFNLCAVGRGVAAVHASVIVCRNEAVLFLGESGTGKSTHTRLWREHIPGTELLNDDSPLVAAGSGVPAVCGSPWSGKTPCYRAERFPIRAFVRLAQAPENRLERLPLLTAYGALQPSFPPSFPHDERLSDRLHALLSALLSRIPVYRMACRPDADAVRTVYDALFDNPSATR